MGVLAVPAVAAGAAAGGGITLGTIATAISVVATAASTLFQINAIRQQGEVAKQNARVQEQAAQDALDRGEIDASEHRLRIASLISSSRTDAASRG